MELLTLRPTLRDFSSECERVLRENDYKGGWAGAPEGFLIEGIRDNVWNLEDNEITIENFLKSCLDIANYAMMLWDNNRENKIIEAEK